LIRFKVSNDELINYIKIPKDSEFIYQRISITIKIKALYKIKQGKEFKKKKTSNK